MTPTNVAYVTAQTDVMTADVAICSIANDGTAPDYWEQTVIDKYYDTTADTPVLYNDTEAVNSVGTVIGASDWSYWIQDYSDNVNPTVTSPFCTYDETFFDPEVKLYLSPYNCTEVKCTMKRKIDTGDNYDA